MPRSINRPKIFTVVRNIWLTDEMFKESLFHSYVAGIPWGEYLRKSVELYNEKSNTEPETKETKERAEKFDDFYRQKTKRQVIKVKNLENNK